jgi:hypothetical protein
MLWAFLPAAPAAAWYLWLFSLGTAWKDNAPTAAALQTGGSTLQTLLHVPPEVDLGGHSIGAPLAFCSFWLWALAPFVLPAGWRTLWGLALLTLLLSFGAWFRVYPGGPGVASPMAWMAVWLPALSLFRFPIRLLWLFHLLSGILASRVLAERWTRGALWVPVALLDLLGSSGMPGRQGWGIASLPSAYRALPDDRPVLEVYGEVLDPSSGEMEMRVRALGCYDQTLHGKPIPEVCIGTALQSPREIMDRWLMRQLSEKDVDPAAVVGVLEKGGVGAVALHLDTLRPSDAKFLFDRLEGALGPPLSESKDAGERLQIFSLSDVHHDVLGFRSVLKSMEE